MADPTIRAALSIIRQALLEDRARHDLTSLSIIPTSQRIHARIIAKAPGIAAAVKVAMLTFTTLDPSLRCRLRVRYGARVSSGQPILTVEGNARSIFAAERVALNLLGHLSGIATLTRAYVDCVRGTRAKILDTRKTLPGLRVLEKDAVRAGGGHNHRSDLAAAVLIKTNHLRALKSATRDKRQATRQAVIRYAIERAKRLRPRRFVEIEVSNLHEFQVALHAGSDAILLDNWKLAAIRGAVRLRGRSRWPLLEVSGGVTLKNVRAIARAGVERISIGRLTHSAPALDCSLEVLSRGHFYFPAALLRRK